MDFGHTLGAMMDVAGVGKLMTAPPMRLRSPFLGGKTAKPKTEPEVENTTAKPRKANKRRGKETKLQQKNSQANTQQIPTNIHGLRIPLNWQSLGVPQAITHVKTRPNPPYKVSDGIKGCHDKMEFAKYSSEYHISSNTPLSSVPGVDVIVYQMKAKNAQGQYTGNLKADVLKKTVYDPAGWPDAKLEKALKEAFQDAVNRNLFNAKGEWKGLTSQGYQIEGYFRNGNIQTFFFTP